MVFQNALDFLARWFYRCIGKSAFRKMRASS